ncbi:hypothetical protein ACT4UM_30190, partial [Bacillus sp. SS-TM]
VKKKCNANGLFRAVNNDELPLIEQWIYQFCEDVKLPTTKEEAKLLSPEYVAKAIRNLLETEDFPQGEIIRIDE